MIVRLAHAELLATDLDAARWFYVDVLGFEEVQRTPERIYLRAAEEFDWWSLAISLADRPGLGHCAFKLSSREGLDALEEVHARLALPTRRVPPGHEAGQSEALRTRTPEGCPIEFIYAMQEIPLYGEDGNPRLPSRHGPCGSGPAPLRIDHVHFRAPDPGQHLEYWEGGLGLRPFAYVVSGERVQSAFLRGRLATHDVALAEGPELGLHHLAYYVADWSDLAYFANRLSQYGWAHGIEVGPTRHNLSNAFCMYIRDPSGNRLGAVHRRLPAGSGPPADSMACGPVSSPWVERLELLHAPDSGGVHRCSVRLALAPAGDPCECARGRRKA